MRANEARLLEEISCLRTGSSQHNTGTLILFTYTAVPGGKSNQQEENTPGPPLLLVCVEAGFLSCLVCLYLAHEEQVFHFYY